MKTISDLVEGLAIWLDSEGLADYKTDAPYGPNDRAVTVKRLPTSPEQALAIFPYDVYDARVLPNVEVSVQLRFRGSPDDRLSVDKWADSVAEKLHWKHHFMLGDIRVQRSERTIMAPLGADENGREERADSYRFTLL